MLVLEQNIFMKPLELLTKELDELERSLAKSREMLHKDVITVHEHETHVANLTPLIKAYTRAISILNVLTIETEK